MYTKESYLSLRNRLRSVLVQLLKKDIDLYANLLKVSGEEDNNPYLIELAFYWGESDDNGGCFRFHLMLNFRNGLRGKVVYLYITHVPQTDVGYNWEGDEIHVHKKNPFTYQSVISGQFLKFMDNLCDPKILQELLEKVVRSGSIFHKPDFINELKAEKA